MLCKTCSTTVSAALHGFISQSVEKSSAPRLTYRFHDSLPGFFESLTLGCHICRKIWISILEHQDNIGVLARALEGSIPETYNQFCQQVQLIQATINTTKSGARILTSFDSICFDAGGEYDGHLYLEVRSLSTGTWLCDFLFFPKSGEVFLPPDFRGSIYEVKGPSTSEKPELWRHWLRNCSESHSRCRLLEQKQAFLPDRLIEIIVDNEENDKLNWRLCCSDINPVIVPYFTLSHCWGSSAHLKLKKTSYASFLAVNRDSDLPKTYQDAFRVTFSLAFRFLWIDSLCIIQDDLEDWRTQSLKMGAIYSNARCNIAATWASDGGDGCFNKRDPFTVTPTTIGLSLASGPSREFQISGKYTYDENINDAPLNRRAWVVQERYLARKQLSFAKNQVYWECREVTASEQFPAGLSEHLLKESGKLKLQPPEAKPSLNFENVQEFRRGWCSLVETYSDCHLTRPSDKMIALAGLAGHFRDINGDTYLAGLWKTALLEQLCQLVSRVWLPLVLLLEASSDRQHIRHLFVDLYCPDDRQRNRSRTSSYYAPTWSWASFDGAVYTDNRYYRPLGEHAHFSEILDVRVDSENSSKLHSFVASELQMRGIMIWARIVAIDSGELPDGGTRHEVLLTRQANSIGASSIDRAKIDVFWDENVVSVGDDPPRWHRLQKERSSELLLMFVLGSSDMEQVELGWENYDGLVLWEKYLPGGKPVFFRLAMFRYGIEFVEMLAAKLNLQPETALEGGLDLNDARLADIVQEVTII